jgi:ADP-ribose pyrophosphatase YjhB (NUDIX family)
MSVSAPRLAVNVAVLDAERHILLTQREDFEVWCLPGGTVDDGESLAEAATRETVEETGLEVRLTRLVGLYSRPRFGGYHTLALFAAVPVGGTLRADPREVIDIGWFSPDALPDDLLWGHRERIADVVRGVGGSIVRSTKREPPDDWPTDRAEHYVLRDRSGLSRPEFYRQLFEPLGEETSPVEVDGRPLMWAASDPAADP